MGAHRGTVPGEYRVDRLCVHGAYQISEHAPLTFRSIPTLALAQWQETTMAFPESEEAAGNSLDAYTWKVYLSAKSTDVSNTGDDAVETLEKEWTDGSNTTYMFESAGSWYNVRVLKGE